MLVSVLPLFLLCEESLLPSKSKTRSSRLVSIAVTSLLAKISFSDSGGQVMWAFHAGGDLIYWSNYSSTFIINWFLCIKLEGEKVASNHILIRHRLKKLPTFWNKKSREGDKKFPFDSCLIKGQGGLDMIDHQNRFYGLFRKRGLRSTSCFLGSSSKNFDPSQS